MSRRLSSPRPAVLAALALVATAAACSELTFEPEDPRTVTFAPSLGIDLAQFQTARNGVYYRDLAVGSGTVVDSADTVFVIYKGYLADGRIFDSTSNTVPSTLRLPVAIPGFRNGVTGARQGSRRVLVIPPAEGYGNSSTPDNRVPAGSVLVFDLNIARVGKFVDTTQAASSSRAPN